MPARIGTLAPKRSTAIPATISASPEPNKRGREDDAQLGESEIEHLGELGTDRRKTDAHERDCGLSADCRCEHGAGRAGSGLLHVFHYRLGVDVDSIVRARRREQALDALEFERVRETTLLAQVEEVLTELEGSRIDEAAFARMTPGDVTLVREVLDPGGVELAEEFDIEGALLSETPAEIRLEREDERLRLEGEVATSRTLQQALERYIEALEAKDGESRTGLQTPL